MKEKILPIIITVIGGLILVNLAVLDVGWLRQQKKQPAETVSSSTSPEIPTAPSSLPSGTCDALCQQMIEEKISQAVATLSGKETIKETETKVVEKTTTQTVSQPQVIYIPLGGSGSTTATDWTDVASAEVYLDLKDYPNLKEARFEGFIKVLHGN
ncbi:hypothetical protein FJZ41_03690, partial [Candidatus Shapirobacteria bacterium]|nr:hypothetical protein [Candidatus Shapirobacteria bacterium]